MKTFSRLSFFVSVLILGSISIIDVANADELVRSTPAPSNKSDSSICEFGGSGVVKKVEPSGYPNFFFRTFNHGGKEYVSYANSGSGLALLDMKTGKESMFNGDYDPVPLNSDIMSTPPENGTMTFYSTAEILKGRSEPTPIVPKNENPLSGVYQSVGELPAKNGKKNYRMITDMSGATSAEYSVVGTKITQTKGPDAICTNIDFKLPMLSKDGKMMSGYDVDTDTTKIWKIKTDGSCEEIFDLGVGVGKADFSYDNNQITFHTSSSNRATDYFESPRGRAMNMNVFVYDLKKKTLKKMTQNTVDENSYYPVFRPDGTIVYSQVGENAKPLFVHADPKKVSAVSYDPKKVSEEKSESLNWIGKRWGARCLDGNISSSTAITTAMTLKPETCKQVIEDAWDDYKDELRSNPNVTKASLLKTCPTKSAELQSIRGRANNDAHASMDGLSSGEKVLATKCAVCHQQFSAANLKGKTVSKELATKVMKRINGEDGLTQMPPGGGISEDERNLVRTFVQGVKSN